MPLIDLTLSRLELDAALLGDGQGEAWVVISPRYAVPLGEGVLLRVRCDAAPTGVFIDGVVQWRRAAPTKGEPAGVGVRVMAHSISRWRFLRRREGAEELRERRASPRLPTRVAVILVTAPRGSTRIYPCAMTDVSDGGAALAMNHRLEPGEQGRCEWAVGARTFAVQFTVVWATPGRIGIRVIDAQPAAVAAWHDLVESAVLALESRLVVPSSAGAAGSAPNHAQAASPSTLAAMKSSHSGLRVDRGVVEVADASRRRKDPRSG